MPKKELQMKELTNAQLKAIEKLSANVIETRAQLAEALCEALGEEFTWSNGFINGHGNSIVLCCGDKLVHFGSYRFKDPKSVAVKYIDIGDYTYNFDHFGKVISAFKRRYERIGNCIYCRCDIII